MEGEYSIKQIREPISEAGEAHILEGMYSCFETAIKMVLLEKPTFLIRNTACFKQRLVVR